ncbi:hypothetical protein GEMRC1_001804 [Eukaryota sp. GEM-RC1]
MQCLDKQLDSLYFTRDYIFPVDNSVLLCKRDEVLLQLTNLESNNQLPKALLWFYRGRTLAGSKSDLELAEAYISKAIKLDSSLVHAYFYLADIHTLRQQWNSAQQLLETSVCKYPTPQALRLLSRVIRQKTPPSIDRSVSLAKEALDLEVNSSEGWLVYALALTTKFFHSTLPTPQSLEKCLSAFNMACKLGQLYNPDLFFNRGQVFKYLERYQEALDDFSKALQLDSTLLISSTEISSIVQFLKSISSTLNRFESNLKKKKRDKLLAGFRQEETLYSTHNIPPFGKPLALKVFALLSSTDKIPSSVFCYDSELSWIVLSVYNVKIESFKVGQTLMLYNARVVDDEIHWEDELFKFRVIRIVNISDLNIIGTNIGSHHLSAPICTVNSVEKL